MRFLYNLILHLLSPFILWVAYKHSHKHPQFTLPNCWRKRRGFNDSLQSGGIWVHAVSAGETIGALPILKQLATSHPNLPLTITNGSLNGAEQVSLFEVDFALQHTMLPLDYPLYIKRFLKQLQPKILIIMETELWPNLYHYCHQYGIKIFLLNTRLTARSYKLYQYFSFAKKLFNKVHWIGVQSDENQQKLISLGVQAEKIITIGNIKSLAMMNQAKKSMQPYWHQWREKLSFCWVAGSVHHDEVEMILQAHFLLQQKTEKKATLILVPRKPVEFAQVIAMTKNVCIKHNWQFALYTDKPQPSSHIDVLIIDKMGYLSQIYAIADIAFVGGSLKPYGGHNILEPAVYSIPIISGPYYYDQKPIYSVFLENQAITICEDSIELANAMVYIENNSCSNNIRKNIDRSMERISTQMSKRLENFYTELHRCLYFDE